MAHSDKWNWSEDEIRRVGYRVVDLIADFVFSTNILGDLGDVPAVKFRIGIVTRHVGVGVVLEASIF